MPKLPDDVKERRDDANIQTLLDYGFSEDEIRIIKEEMPGLFTLDSYGQTIGERLANLESY
ncbi:MAG: hypothetical protein ACPL06_04305, partial [Candidatus Anstonellales archaeon]